ncbi:hypothetical protein X777_13462 [Ooceraea biroi]|uniref:Uncharacterized protein n=1 Tax=Ooceraea biroi TaxID=2015173 RepID=A0A026WX06_OOCBI|nr:hypothetical protein X777_13462 [Ooceraea biroi]
MTLATIQKFVLSSCKANMYLEAYQRILPSLSILQKNIVIQTELSVHRTCTTQKRFLHDTSLLLKNKLKENEDVPDSISALQIKTRVSRKRSVINDNVVPKSNAWNVKALATAEEYNLENLAYGLSDQQLYVPSKISTSTNCKYLHPYQNILLFRICLTNNDCAIPRNFVATRDEILRSMMTGFKSSLIV